jgi:hypothetical protein
VTLTHGGMQWRIAQVPRSVHIGTALYQSGHLVSRTSCNGYMQWTVARVAGTVHIVERKFEELTEMLL